MLQGKRILVTRARRQASDLAERLSALGAVPLVLPAIEIEEPTDVVPLDAALRSVGSFDWVVFTSVNGVRAVAERLSTLGLPPNLGECRLAAVGPATAGELARLCRSADLVPPNYVSDSLADALGDLRDCRVLLPRGDLARENIIDDLADAGAAVTEVEAYRTVAARWPEGPLPTPDIVTFTSSSGVLATHERLAERGLLGWFAKPIVCIGPVTCRTVEDLGFQVAATAREHTIQGVVEAVREVADRA